MLKFIDVYTSLCYTYIFYYLKTFNTNLTKIIPFETFEVYIITILKLRMNEKSENFQH